MKKIIVFVIYFIVAFSVQLFAENVKMRLAVLDLKPQNVDLGTAKVVSNMLRTSLIDSNVFVIIERGQMDEILNEQGFQQTGCTDSSCAVEIGKLLSTNKILIGEISKLGKSFIITSRVVDVEKGVAEYAVQEKAASEDVLDLSIKKLSAKLISRITENDDYEYSDSVDKKSNNKVNLPSGLRAGYTGYLPTDKDISSHYSFFNGGMIGYQYNYMNFLAGTAAAEILFASEDTVSVMITNIVLGFKAGIPLAGIIYPFIGISCLATIYRETSESQTANFTGFGGRADAGISFMFTSMIGFDAKYSYQLGALRDDNKSDINGHILNGSLIIKF